MTRRLSLLISGLGFALLLLGLQSWGIAVGRVENYIVARIEDRVGITVTGLARAEIAFLPLPRISLSQVAFKRNDGLVSGKATRLRARARLLPLLVGQLAFDRIELSGGEIDVATDASDALGGWLSGPLGALAKLQGQSKIVLSSTAIFMRSQGQIRSTLRDVDLVVDEREGDEPISLSGSLTWRGVPAEVKLVWPLSGRDDRVSLAVSSEPMTLRFDGSRSGLSDPVINGRLALSTRTLPALFQWFGEKPWPAEAIGKVSLNADAQIKPNESSLSNLTAVIDGDTLVGALKLGDAGSRMALSGTLAGAGFDLGRLTAGVGPWLAATSDPAGIDFERWTENDIDLRISVEAARLNGARLRDVATYLLVKKGRFEAGLLRASAYGGTLKGRVLATSLPAGIEVKVQTTLDKVDLGKGADDIPWLSRWAGTASAHATLDALGASRLDLSRSLSGKAGLTLANGDIGNLSILDLVRKGERNRPIAPRDWPQGKTPFDNATLTVAIAEGLAQLGDAQITGPAYRVAMTGQAALAPRRLDLLGRLTPTAGATAVPFTLSGPFDDLALTLEAAPAQPGMIIPTQLMR